jgi:hypothetical protein
MHALELDSKALGTRIHRRCGRKNQGNGASVINIPMCMININHGAVRWSSIARMPLQRQPLAPPHNLVPLLHDVPPPGFTKLADKYLSLDDMRISDSSSLQTQTIEQEFQAYITAPVCAEGTDIVKYWEVRHCVDE